MHNECHRSGMIHRSQEAHLNCNCISLACRLFLSRFPSRKRLFETATRHLKFRISDRDLLLRLVQMHVLSCIVAVLWCTQKCKCTMRTVFSTVFIFSFTKSIIQNFCFMFCKQKQFKRMKSTRPRSKWSRQLAAIKIKKIPIFS